VRVEHVMKGYRADSYSQVETLVHMALLERSHAVFSRNLEAQITEPVLKGLVGRIAKDEERHEEFFANLVAHCLTTQRAETIAAIATRAAGLETVGADIDAYRDKVRVVAEAGIFDDAALHEVITDRLADWGVSDAPELAELVSH
jgi:acyl-[acyl-carrier-protein] desaturase